MAYNSFAAAVAAARNAAAAAARNAAAGRAPFPRSSDTNNKRQEDLETEKEQDMNIAEAAEDNEDETEVYQDYRPAKLAEGCAHPDAAIETASLASVAPPDITYKHHLGDIVQKGTLSSLQLESVVYANMRFAQTMEGGQRYGFFLGDGAGVGKGRQIAANIVEHVRTGGGRVLWVSVSADLRLDAARDLRDLQVADAQGIAASRLFPRSDALLPQGNLSTIVGDGVVFCTYSFLISGSPKVKKEKEAKRQDGAGTSTDVSGDLEVDPVIGGKKSRAKQLVEWLKAGDGPPLLIFDECHKVRHTAATTNTCVRACATAIFFSFVVVPVAAATIELKPVADKSVSRPNAPFQFHVPHSRRRT